MAGTISNSVVLLLAGDEKGMGCESPTGPAAVFPPLPIGMLTTIDHWTLVREGVVG